MRQGWAVGCSAQERGGWRQEGPPACRHHTGLMLGRPGQGPAHSRCSRPLAERKDHPGTPTHRTPLTLTKPQRAVIPWGGVGHGAMEHLAGERTPGKSLEGSLLQQESKCQPCRGTPGAVPRLLTG